MKYTIDWSEQAEDMEQKIISALKELNMSTELYKDWLSVLHGFQGTHIQGFSEYLQHYTKLCKANCADQSIYGVQIGLKFVLLHVIALCTTATAADHNLSLLKQ